MARHIKVIDLFAGPGGLGEGFSAYEHNGKRPFSVAISIEKDPSAHQTLLLRSLFRRLKEKGDPRPYYDFLKGRLGDKPNQYLYELSDINRHLRYVRNEAIQLTLGEDRAATEEVIQKVIGKNTDCVLIGGPPCQAYSLIGRAKNYGDKAKKYNPEADDRNFLYQEYLHILAKFEPAIFVMENVKGILSAKVKDDLIFQKIMEDLANPASAERGKKSGSTRYEIIPFVVPERPHGDLLGAKYDARDYIINAERHLVPQTRHRVILLGIRTDILRTNREAPSLTKHDTYVTVSHAIDELPRLRSQLSKQADSAAAWKREIAALKKLLPQLDIEPILRTEIEGVVTEVSESDMPTRSASTSGRVPNLPSELKEWIKDPELGHSLTNHESRGHIVGDLHRYLFCAAFAQVYARSPKAADFPSQLTPKHQNFDSGKFVDRFKVQRMNAPGTTITSHISKDGHYYIHYDPTQCRSLTVREAARIQTFPDNYFFCGNKTQQYVQVGNAVPPYLAKQLAQVVHGILR